MYSYFPIAEAATRGNRTRSPHRLRTREDRFPRVSARQSSDSSHRAHSCCESSRNEARSGGSANLLLYSSKHERSKTYVDRKTLQNDPVLCITHLRPPQSLRVR